MATARTTQVNLDATPYYHCVSRCVRRAFLCGKDTFTGRNFDHRKEWLETRLRRLSGVFAVDTCAYAVMSNHFHLVVRVDAERALSWDEDEVAERYGSLFPMAKKVFEQMPKRERQVTLKTWRERLSSLSWMMRSLNEWLARKANKEDGCKGRFWEGRFSSQPLLDEASVLTCMAYVDLNPVRAGLCKTLSGASFTSIRARLEDAARVVTSEGASDKKRRATPAVTAAVAGTVATTASKLPRSKRKQMVPEGLAPFIDQVSRADANAAACGELDAKRPMPIAMNFADYVELLEWTGRQTRASGPSGTLSAAPSGKGVSLVEALQLCPAHWLRTMQGELSTRGVLGAPSKVQAYAEAQGKRWVRGIGHAKRAAA